ncbi:hypothetical protein B0T36_21575 [Nocardia donostiensis]|uniref:DUF3099 domain-containing protein n=1 Tax=Nocardia donostiensis TaxID=1538463 RepID=UPI0009D9EC82|nr:DUF3099 domain-containing protein [Nocardia donostiensis]OQS13136.1 hypothetical protein B0T36_21575 [Nocardia donostiensis]
MNSSGSASRQPVNRTGLLSRRPPSITDAQPSYQDQHRTRVRAYLLLMSFRVPALLIAWGVYAATGAALLCAGILVVSAPLSWTAVLIANDRPPLRRGAGLRRFRPGRRDAETVQPRLPATVAATVALLDPAEAVEASSIACRGRSMQ